MLEELKKKVFHANLELVKHGDRKSTRLNSSH